MRLDEEPLCAPVAPQRIREQRAEQRLHPLVMRLGAVGDAAEHAGGVRRAVDHLPLGLAGRSAPLRVLREGVEETARFVGSRAEFFDLPHDVMLCAGREAPADRIVEWVRSLPRADCTR